MLLQAVVAQISQFVQQDESASNDTKRRLFPKSPSNTIIEVKLVSFTKVLSQYGCLNAGVEIKTNQDQTVTGYRFCSPQDAGVTLRSHSNLVPVITYNRYHRTTTELQYRSSETDELFFTTFINHTSSTFFSSS
ncbi:unnamed protein product [Heligmosomoides polygyrus]|uniref:CUB domain-containing protein n=1 Tax=Heligmosomoides polygyrus TaxID=6339 RepID=A0A183FZ32_HELPZ|nr:unnamed protein product [Heligmosomoides polygyrus]